MTACDMPHHPQPQLAAVAAAAAAAAAADAVLFVVWY